MVFSLVVDGSRTPLFTRGLFLRALTRRNTNLQTSFLSMLRQQSVSLSRGQIKALKKCVDLLNEQNLRYLLEYPDRFVIVEAPFSFADKPQMIVYLDQGKGKFNFLHRR